MFDLITLGSVDLTSSARGSVHTLLAQPKRLALLVYLAIEGAEGFVRRESLLPMFWPESDETRARASLRQALQFLRRSLGDDVLIARGDDEVGVNFAVITCDAVQFNRAIGEGALRAALELYRGEFLPSFHVDDAPEFDRWMGEQRRVMQRSALQCAGTLAGQLAGQDPGQAIEVARRATRIDPLDEDAARRLALLVDSSGNRASALVVLNELRDALRSELDLPVSPETEALEQSLRARASGTSGPNDLSQPPVLHRERTQQQPVISSRTASGLSWRSAAVSAILLAIVTGGWLMTRDRWREPPDASRGGSGASITDSRRIVVIPFANNTGDTTLAPMGAMIADWITEGLSRVDDFRVVPLTAVSATMSAREQAGSDAALSRNPWSPISVAQELGAGIMVSGAAYRTGNTMHLQVQVTDVATGALAGPAETVSVPSDSIMVGIDKLRQRVLASIAPLSDTVSHLRRALAPPSYEAYRDYVNGLQQFVRGDPAEALVHFERSARADSSYPMPQLASAIMLLNLRRSDEAQAMTLRLASRRDRLGPLERATLEMVEGILAGDLVATERAAREQARIAPNTIGHYMVAEMSRSRGNPREALLVLREIGPDRGELRGWRPYWRELTGALHMLGRFDDEAAAAREALQRHPTHGAAINYLMRAFAAQGDLVSIDSLLDARSNQVSEELSDEGALAHAAWTGLDARGERESAVRLQKRELAFLSSVQGNIRSPAIRLRHTRAMLLDGDAAAAYDSALLLARDNANSPSVQGVLAIAAQKLGRNAEFAHRVSLLEGIDSARSPAERAMARGDVAYWLAAIAAQRGDAETAGRVLRAAYASGRWRDIALDCDPWFAPIRQAPTFRALTTYR